MGILDPKRVSPPLFQLPIFAPDFFFFKYVLPLPDDLSDCSDFPPPTLRSTTVPRLSESINTSVHALWELCRQLVRSSFASLSAF